MQDNIYLLNKRVIKYITEVIDIIVAPVGNSWVNDKKYPIITEITAKVIERIKASLILFEIFKADNAGIIIIPKVGRPPIVLEDKEIIIAKVV